MTWNFHQSTREPIVNVDFKKMNKEKIKASEPKSKVFQIFF